MSEMNIRQQLADIRIYIGYSEIDQKRLNDIHHQQLMEARARLLATRPELLLEAFMSFRKGGLHPIKPEITQNFQISGIESNSEFGSLTSRRVDRHK